MDKPKEYQIDNNTRTISVVDVMLMLVIIQTKSVHVAGSYIRISEGQSNPGIDKKKVYIKNNRHSSEAEIINTIKEKFNVNLAYARRPLVKGVPQVRDYAFGCCFTKQDAKKLIEESPKKPVRLNGSNLTIAEHKPSGYCPSYRRNKN